MGGLTPIVPGTRDPALLSARGCADCHEAIYRQWQTSRHALAWTNGIFQSEYRRGPRRWCVHCHAPLTPQVAQVVAGGGDLADEGVGCAACHVRHGRIVARVQRPDSPHNTLATPDFGGIDFCADCHEFTFPVFDERGRAQRMSPHPMQATVSQFRRATADGDIPWPETTSPTEHRGDCRTCHAADGAGHGYRGAHDPAMLKRALDIAVCRDDEAAVLSLNNRGAGHNVPTGDIHRHMAARMWRSSAPERLFDAYIGRRFTIDPEGGKRTTWDSTIAPSERRRYRVPLDSLGGTDEEAVAWEVRYVYVANENPRLHHPGEPTYRVIAEGRIPARDMAPCGP